MNRPIRGLKVRGVGSFSCSEEMTMSFNLVKTGTWQPTRKRMKWNELEWGECVIKE